MTEDERPVRETAIKPCNGYSIAGLILCIASVLLAPIGIIPVLAVILSGIGLAKVKDRSGKGKVQAWMGLILCILYILVYLQIYSHIQ